MDWSRGYSAAYHMTRLDPATWRDVERHEITGGSVKRTQTGLRESAAVDCGIYPNGVENWIRIYLDANQNGATEHVALFTGLATSPGEEFDGRMRSGKLDCYSVLKPAEDVKLLHGWYAAAGRSGGDVIKELLRPTPAPVVIADGAPALSYHIIAEDQETNLSMVEKILTAINWRIRITGDGTISVEPPAQDPAASFDPIENDVIETKISVKADWFNCPNVYAVTQGDLTAIARDDDPESPLSTVTRGREVWQTEKGGTLAENEGIAEYARRRLKEAQQVFISASYDRRYFDGVIPGDLVYLHYPEQNLDGVYTVKTQSIALTYAATTSEETEASA